MTKLLAEIDRMATADGFPVDGSGCLSAVLQWLHHWGGLAVFLADQRRRVLGTYPPPTGKDRDTLRAAVRSLSTLLAQDDFAETTVPASAGGDVTVIGARASADDEARIFLGALLDPRCAAAARQRVDFGFIRAILYRIGGPTEGPARSRSTKNSERRDEWRRTRKRWSPS